MTGRPSGSRPCTWSSALDGFGVAPGGAAFFVHGVRVYQATAIGEALPEESLTSFFAAIKLAP